MEPMMNPMEQMREAIRAEIAKANPIEGARTSLELIAESSVRPVREGGTTRFEVVDETGQPRMAERGGASVPFTLADLVAELRGRHPTLFQAGAPAAPPARPTVADAVPPQPAAPAMAAAPAPAVPATPAPAPVAPRPRASPRTKEAAVPASAATSPSTRPVVTPETTSTSSPVPLSISA